MKQGDLVYFSAQHLAFDFEQLRGQYGLLLQYLDIPGRDGIAYPSWRTLWGEKLLIVYQKDISLVEPNAS